MGRRCGPEWFWWSCCPDVSVNRRCVSSRFLFSKLFDHKFDVDKLVVFCLARGDKFQHSKTRETNQAWNELTSSILRLLMKLVGDKHLMKFLNAERNFKFSSGWRADTGRKSNRFQLMLNLWMLMLFLLIIKKQIDHLAGCWKWTYKKISSGRFVNWFFHNWTLTRAMLSKKVPGWRCSNRLLLKSSSLNFERP